MFQIRVSLSSAPAGFKRRRGSNRGGHARRGPGVSSGCHMILLDSQA